MTILSSPVPVTIYVTFKLSKMVALKNYCTTVVFWETLDFGDISYAPCYTHMLIYFISQHFIKCLFNGLFY